MVEKYQHIIWDWNGTLFNDVGYCVEIINGILRDNDLPLVSIKTYRDKFTFPVKNYYHQLGFDFAKISFEDLSEIFISHYERSKNQVTLFTEVNETLSAIQKQGIEQSVLSAYSQNKLHEIIFLYSRPLR